MAGYVKCDSFDWYTGAQATLFGWSSTFGTMATGRFGSGQACLISSSSNSQISFANLSSLSIGIAGKINGTLASTTFFQFLDAGSAQIDLRLGADGKISVTRNGTVLSTTSAVVITANVWFDLVFTITFSNTGSYELFMGQVSVTSGSGVDTTATANNYANIFKVQSPTLVGMNLDDFWLYDGIINPGDLRLEEQRPNGNGYSSQFVGSDGNSTDNHLLIDDPTSYNSADYLDDSTAGHIDSQTTSNLPTVPASIAFVVAKMIAKKTDAGSRVARIGLRSGGVNYESGDLALGVSDTILEGTYHTTDPNTSAAWTESGVNALEVFEKVQS